MRPTEHLKAQILAHAKENLVEECCGLIVSVRGRPRYVRCRNRLAGKRTEFGPEFAIDGIDYARASDMGDIATIVHSHIDRPPLPSPADLVGCEYSKRPWYIINPRTGEDFYFEPTGYVQPLLCRPFVYGVFDCYTQIRDAYKEQLKIELPYFESEFGWWSLPKGEPGWNMYRDNFAAAGFVEIPIKDIRPYDCLLMRHRADRENHAALWIGEGMIQHHAMGRLSCREVYGGYWRDTTTVALRYAGARP